MSSRSVLVLFYLWEDARIRIMKSVPKNIQLSKDWMQAEKGITEVEMVGWHHQLNGHKFEQAPGGVKERDGWCAAVHGGSQSHDWATEQQQCKDLSHQIPWSTEFLIPPWTPSRDVEGQQLQRHRVQSLQRQMVNALCCSVRGNALG